MNYSVSISAVPAPGALAAFGLAAMIRRRRR
jgi:MYXO-CTERM domain-containing protein